MHLTSIFNKVVGEIKFMTQSHLHVGEHEPGSTLLRIMKLPDGSYLIPAPTWKGCLRSIAEKLAPSLRLQGLEKLALKAYSSGGLRIKDVDRELTDYISEFRTVLLKGGESTIISQSRQELLRILIDIGYSEEIEDGRERIESVLMDMAADYLALHCPLGRLFGNKVIASKLRPQDTLIEAPVTERRPGVGIDRESATVKGDILFFIEALPTNLTVKMRFVADNLVPGAADSRLLAGVLDWIEKIGLQIGGRKSVGLGFMKPVNYAFHLVEMSGVDAWKQLANPLKHAKKLTLEQFVKFAKGHEQT